jgi:hypothetical protein
MTTLNETMKLLTPELRQEVFDFAKYLVRKHSKRKSKIGNSKERIMKLAGAWKDMDEKDFQHFLDDIYGRREKSFSGRPSI